MNRWMLCVAAAMLTLATTTTTSCGPEDDPEPEELTCEYLEDEDNCWAVAAAALKDCLPEGQTEAVLAADRESCEFSDGTRIVFEDALPMDTIDLERFAFTIMKNGAPCGGFVDTFENKMELTGGGETVTSQLRGDFELICGDGQEYETEFETLFDCEYGSQPTDGFSVEPELVTFMILSVNTPGELFRCVP